MSPRRAAGVLTILLGALGCSGPQDGAAQGPRASTASPGTHPPRARPSDHAVTHAFERVTAEVVRCLRPGDTADVSGGFDGPSGAFHAARVTAAGPSSGGSGGGGSYAVETCVRVAVEQAHVRPFTDPTASAAYAFTVPPAGAASTAGTPPPGRGSALGLVTPMVVVNAGPSPVELIRRETGALRQCYDQACARDHTIAGGVEVHMVLDGAGAITSLTSRVDTRDEDPTLMQLVARCVEAHIRLISFGPQVSPNVETVVPLTFQSGTVPVE